MANILSHRSVSLILNGYRFEAFADDDPPVDFGDMDIYEITHGQDGGMYAHDTSMLGGEVIVKLLPTSNSAIKVIQWFAMRQASAGAGGIIFSGTYGDATRGYSIALQRGVLRRCHPIIVPNKTFECTFEFERFVPSVDGVRFEPAPAAA